MKEEIKISVVVPVYNVEKYLKKCVDSLLNQTYKNFEIILVDDGSSDSSGRLCDSYAEQSRNIFVLHKQNGGLSDARNCAMSYIRGQYVTFVDSDDYVDTDFLEKLAKPLTGNMAQLPDMVICPHINESLNQVSLLHRERNQLYQVLEPEKALEMMCYEKEFGTSACAKLISDRLVKKFPFPKGKLYEDLATVYKMIGDSRVIVFLNVPMYHYIQRKGSIRKGKWNPSVFDIMEASGDLLNYISAYFPDIYKAGVQRYFFSANEAYIRAFNEKDYLKIISPVQKELHNMWKVARGNPHIRARQKLRYWMLINCPALYRRIWTWNYVYKERKNKKIELLWKKK